MSPANFSRQPVLSVRPDIALRVEAEVPRLLYRTAGFGLYSNFMLALVLVAGVWTYFPSQLTLGWLAIILSVSLARLGVNLTFARKILRDDELRPWRHLFVTGVVLAGCTWGAGGWLFLQTNELLPRC